MELINFATFELPLRGNYFETIYFLKENSLQILKGFQQHDFKACLEKLLADMHRSQRDYFEDMK